MTLKKIDEELNISSMPEGKDWMSISKDIVHLLSKEEMEKILLEMMNVHLLSKEEMEKILLKMMNGGQNIHNEFYGALEINCSSRRVLSLIRKAKLAK